MLLSLQKNKSYNNNNNKRQNYLLLNPLKFKIRIEYDVNIHIIIKKYKKIKKILLNNKIIIITNKKK